VCLSSSRSFVDCVEVMGNMIRQLGYFVGIEGKLGTNVASTLNVKLVRSIIRPTACWHILLNITESPDTCTCLRSDNLLLDHLLALTKTAQGCFQSSVVCGQRLYEFFTSHWNKQQLQPTR
jgi:hypothetical protein